MKMTLFVVALLLCAPLAWAQNPPVAITFDSLNENVKVTTQFAGITFANATTVTAGVTLNELEFPARSGSRVVVNDGGAIVINFNPPVYGIEGYVTYNNRLTLLVFDSGGNQIGTAFSQFTSNMALSGVTGSSANELLWFASIPPIARIVISPQDNGAYTLDDFRVTETVVPTIYEGDAAPRPAGNKALTLADWVQVGRFAIGLDPLTAGSEYQRVDSAPKATKGDGVITIGDWVQSGRYAAGLDPLTLVGGPTTLGALAAITGGEQASASESSRSISALSDTRDMGTLLIRLEALGNENALAFSLNYNPQAVTFGRATLEAGLEGASLIVNETQARTGKIGLAVAMPPGKTLPGKAAALLKVKFNPVGTNYPVTTPVSFSDAPTRRTLVDTEANNLPGTYTDVSLLLRGRDETQRREPTRRGTTPRP